VHEMGITQGILEASFDAAEKAGAQRITEIRITVGELTEIQEFALDFAFQSLTPGTMAEGATLVVTTVAPSSRCRECGLQYDHDRFEMLCPACGSFNVEPLTGRELRIDSIEADDGSDLLGEADAESAEATVETSEE
jgi:hydrogenase nickel incorporation protein HypA/HybF